MVAEMLRAGGFLTELSDACAIVHNPFGNSRNRIGVNFIMKYMVDTIIKHVVRETDRNSGILRFVLPSYPPELLMEIGCKLEEEFYMRRDSKIELEYGIAYRLAGNGKTAQIMRRHVFLVFAVRVGTMRQTI